MNTLDLHGIRHREVDLLVENFILLNQNEVPLTIVCGGSGKMVELTNNVINRIGCEWVVMDLYGVIKIRKIWMRKETERNVVFLGLVVVGVILLLVIGTFVS